MDDDNDKMPVYDLRVQNRFNDGYVFMLESYVYNIDQHLSIAVQ